MKKFSCPEYTVFAPEKCCLFCSYNSDVFYDYTNGPYMFLCNEGDGELVWGIKECSKFKEDENA